MLFGLGCSAQIIRPEIFCVPTHAHHSLHYLHMIIFYHQSNEELLSCISNGYDYENEYENEYDDSDSDDNNEDDKDDYIFYVD